MAPVIRTMETRSVRPEPKAADPFYESEAHRAWRAEVLRRAGFRCQAIDNGEPCTKAAPDDRLFADHIKERRDGGSPLDPANGQCLCGRHHTLKTFEERRRRMGR